MTGVRERLTISRRAAERMAAGHPWAFSNEVGGSLKAFAPGQQVEIAAPGGRPLGYGFVNPHSLIAVRLLAHEPLELGPSFFADRLRRAAAHRERFLPGAESFRLCFGESDGLAGLVVDRYGDLYVVQSHAAGIDLLAEAVAGGLVDAFSPAGVLLKFDSATRALEGLDSRIEVVHGTVPDQLEIEIEGGRFALDLRRGQKTGFYFDQAENRARLAQWTRGARVLDVFSYVGAWALAAARGGAMEVLGIDSSEAAVAWARRSAELSGVAERVRFAQADAFERLAAMETGSERWDVVVLDPPAFVKSKRKLREGLRGYHEINRRGVALVRPGGILATSSCSRHVTRDAFLEVVRAAVGDARRFARVIGFGRQAADHPIHPHLPETEYLTCLFFAIE